MTLGSAIRERRIELGLTQEALAQLIGDGVRQAEVSRLESDRIALPRRRRLEHIADGLGLTIDELLARSGRASEDQAGTKPERYQRRRTRSVASFVSNPPSSDGALTFRSQSRQTSMDRNLLSEHRYEDRLVHTKWLDRPVHDGDTPTMSFSDCSDRGGQTKSRTGSDHDRTTTPIEPDSHAGGAIALVIDRLTAAMLETASLRRSIVSETATANEIVDDLRLLEETLKDLGTVLRKLQERPYESGRLVNPQTP